MADLFFFFFLGIKLFSSVCTNSHSYQQVPRSPFSTPFPAFAVYGFSDNHPDGVQLKAQCGSLHFPDG